MKRFFSLLLILGLLIGLLPAGAVKVHAATTLTLAQLREKFPHGKYWNHVDKPGYDNNNQDGYSSSPCPRHGNIYSSSQTCNGFAPNGRQLSWQCMGYAEKLGYDATGYNPRNDEGGWTTYTSSSALNNLKPGDIVRYNGHSIYVTAVNGDTVVFTDCNYTAKCYIRWDATISISKLRASFEYLQSAPFAMTDTPVDCGCSEEYAGIYRCTTETSYLNIRSGHGTSFGIVSSIPPGGIVTVTEASGTSKSDWAHVEYNGYTGYASMQYLQKQETAVQLFTLPGVTMSLGNDLALYFYVTKTDISDASSYMQITKTYADGRANTVKTVPMGQWLSSGDYYLVCFDGISAKEMKDTLTAVVYSGEGVRLSTEKQTSVAQYALNMLGKPSTEVALKKVLADMLNYGAAAQKEFGYNTADLANAGMTQEQAGYATQSFDASALSDHTEKGVGWGAGALSLKSSIVINVFHKKSVVSTDMTAKIHYTNHNGKTVSYAIAGSAFQNYNDTYLYLDIDTLVAGDLNTVVSIDIYDGDTLVSASKYSLASYCANHPLEETVVALAKFCSSAHQYFHP